MAPCTSKLRRKNRLSRAGRTEEGNALARRIGKDIAARNRTRLSRINHKKCATDMWAAVRQLTGRRHKDEVCNGITAETLNQHYARISTDSAYQRQPRKLTATHREVDFVSEWQLFSILDTLTPTATQSINQSINQYVLISTNYWPGSSTGVVHPSGSPSFQQTTCSPV